MLRVLLAAFLLVTILNFPATAKDAQQSTVKPAAAQKSKYPKIVLYSASWCPHCKAAKEYFTSHNIPFINKDVEADPAYMDELSKRYKSQAVPVIVIGEDKIILRGFNQEKFEKSLKEVGKGK